MTIHIVGDSHCRIFVHMQKTYDMKIHLKVRSSVTLYRVVRDGLEILLRDTHERRHSEIESHATIKEGDYVLFSFGYADITNNMLKYEKIHNIQLLSDYVDAIELFCKGKSAIPIIQVDTMPQTSDLSNEHFGSLESRINLRIWMYKELKKLCDDRCLVQFKCYEVFEKEDKTFDYKKYKSEDNVHLGHSARTFSKCKSCYKCTGEHPRYVWESLNNVLNNVA
jgi:hypothetical protein